MRLSEAGAEEVLRTLRTNGSENGRLWAEHTLGVIGATVAKAGVKKAAAESGSKGKLDRLTAGMDAMIADRDAYKAELELYQSLCSTPQELRQLLLELDEYRRGGKPAASPGLVDVSTAPMTPGTPAARGRASAAASTSSQMPGLGGMIPSDASPYVTPRDTLTQTMAILDDLGPRVQRLRSVVESSEPVEVIDEMVQLVLRDLDHGYATIFRLEEGLARRKVPASEALEDVTAFLGQLKGAREGVRALRDEVAALASATEDAVDQENAEDNMAILELAEMLQGLMQAAKAQT